MSDEKPKDENDGVEERRHASVVNMPGVQAHGTRTTQHSSGVQTPEPQVHGTRTTERNAGVDMGNAGPAAKSGGDMGNAKSDSLVDGRLDPDAQSPGKESTKPFDPKENDVA